jgi:hypothetical protein
MKRNRPGAVVHIAPDGDDRGDGCEFVKYIWASDITGMDDQIDIGQCLLCRKRQMSMGIGYNADASARGEGVGHGGLPIGWF